MGRAGRRHRPGVVAAFENRYQAPLAVPIGDFDDFARDPFEVGVVQAQIAERVFVVGVETGRDQDEFGLEAGAPRDHAFAEHPAVFCAAAPAGQPHVDDVAVVELGSVPADFLGVAAEPGEGAEIVLANPLEGDPLADVGFGRVQDSVLHWPSVVESRSGAGLAPEQAYKSNHLTIRNRADGRGGGGIAFVAKICRRGTGGRVACAVLGLVWARQAVRTMLSGPEHSGFQAKRARHARIRDRG